MGGSAKAPKQSDESRRLEKLNTEMLQLQLKQAKNPQALPKIETPKPLPPPPPPAMESGDAAQKAEEERRKAGRRTNSTRNTLFAGESGGYRPAVKSTLLG